MTGDLIPITSDLKVVGSKTEKIQKLLSNQSIQELIHQGILVQLKKLQPKICETKTESDCDTTTRMTLPNTNENIEENIKTVKMEEIQVIDLS